MKIQAGCRECIYKKQLVKAEKIQDTEKREAYLRDVEAVLRDEKETISSPYVGYRMNRLWEQHTGAKQSYKAEKEQFNAMVLRMESMIEQKIEEAEDPLEKSLIYARIGNYIDFGGALKKVDPEEFLRLLESDCEKGLSKPVYEEFCRQCENGSQFLLLSDNCGEIVLDKLFLKQMKKRYPRMKLSVMVRGEETVNDATAEDAAFCGIDQIAEIISNGNGAAGTVWELLSEEAKNAIKESDVILAKGQGNYESLAECGENIFYSFLCKCDLFTELFQVPKLTGMFVHETLFPHG